MTLPSAMDVTEASTSESLCGDNPELLNATMVAYERGVLTPLIKQELKYTIQNRRFAEGKQELTVEFPEPVNQPLTEEELEKAERRREQNRLAAKRFRRKQRDTTHILHKRIKSIEADYRQLLIEHRALKQERDYLAGKLHAHLLLCSKEEHSTGIT